MLVISVLLGLVVKYLTDSHCFLPD